MKDKTWVLLSGFLAGVVVLLLYERLQTPPRPAADRVRSASQIPGASRAAEDDVDPYIKGPVKNTIVKNAKTLQTCYLDLLKKVPGAAGHITLDATIKDSGGVEKSEVVRSDIDNPDFQKCLTAKFAAIVFPVPPRAGFYVEHTFTFKAE